MTTKITTVFDDLLAKVEALLPNHTKIPDPYNLENNTSVFLEQGFGMTVGGQDNSNRMISCKASTDHDFEIKISRKYYSLDSDTTAKDQTQKNLCEDFALLKLNIESDPTLANGGNIRWTGSSSIESVFTEKNYFLSLTGNVSVEYFDSY